MNKPICLFAALVPILLSTVALGDTALRHKAGTESWTEPAGAVGSSAVELVTNPDYYGLQALKIWEFDRRLCSLQIEQGSLNARATGVLEAVKVCEPKLSQAWKRADIGSGLFVTSISVCTAKAEQQPSAIRGVQLWGAALDSNAKQTPAKKPVNIEFAACERWSPKRSCPKGSIATGLRAYIADADQGVIGLSLRCHEIEANRGIDGA